MSEKTTEQQSPYRHIEKMDVIEILNHINHEDHTVTKAIQNNIHSIEKLITQIVDKMLAGGRLFYIGAGTSGRLGVLDASECPPTFGVPKDLVIGIIAGGMAALQKAVEHAEDDLEKGWQDLKTYNITEKDIVIGLTASGTTPYVLSALKECKKNNIITGCITCNCEVPIIDLVDYPIAVVVGPEFITGSTRMKSGTAQKLILNMISTTVMIKIGRIEDNKMVHLQLTNDKLIDRGTKMVMEGLHLTNYEKAKQLLLKYGSVKATIDNGLV